jgi:UDP-N-acetylmuramyl tripeptide synthase
LPAAGHAIGLFEVDEAALPQVLRAITPRRLVLLDIFRDQLDRYGEVATVATDWSDAVRRLPPQTVVVANADDPLVAAVAESTPGNVVLFGIESAQRMATEPEHASDVKACPRCGGPVIYDRIFLGHLGHYRCSRCAVARPRPDVTARDVRLNGVRGSRFTLCPGGTELLISFPLPGMYNVYNAVGAAAAAHSLGVAPEHIQTGLEAATAAFGRMEPIDIDGAHAFLALAKNPTGLNEVLRTIVETPGPAHLLVMLNDNTADGRDVSWIWDADVEMLAGAPASILFSGTRAEDMALRFKYAGVLAGENPPVWEVQKVTREAVKRASREVRDGETLFIVPTYTAMLDVRQVLTEMGYVRPYWEE